MEFFKDNYLETSGSGDNWKVSFNSFVRQHQNFYLESIRAAELFWQKKQGKCFLMYSGGVDSEFILNVFLHLGMKIQPVIIDFDYNKHDIKYALDFCNAKKLDPLVIKFNFDEFVKSGRILNLALDCECAEYRLLSTFNVVEKLDGTILMGSHGPPHIALDQDSNSWKIDELEVLHSVIKLFKNKNLYGCPFFLVYTIEQYLSFLKDPVMIQLVNNQIPGKLGNNSSKWRSFNNNNNFNMVQRTKYTGFEQIEKSDIFSHNNIKIIESFKNKWNGKFEQEYFSLVAKLQGN